MKTGESMSPGIRTLLRKILSPALLLLACLPAGLWADQTVTTFNRVHQNNGTRSVEQSFGFPASFAGFNAIRMTYTLECPDGGCDPWDRYADVRIKKNGTEYELGRYMTPYGRGYSWTMDVTDFAGLLQGATTLSSFIDTWTNPGWLVTLQFTFVSGSRDWDEVLLENLWNDGYKVVGDPGRSAAFADQRRPISTAAVRVKVRLTNTGHGQGNTENGAEFNPKTHRFTVNGAGFDHNPWRNDCASNPCQPQGGTWIYNRAGWCPGDKVAPTVWDITSRMTPGQVATLQYALASYVNQCRPSNASCVSGTTCGNCDYDNNGHTEPHYKVAGQLVTYLKYAPRVAQRYALRVVAGVGSAEAEAGSRLEVTAGTAPEGMRFSRWETHGLGIGDERAITTQVTLPEASKAVPDGIYRVHSKRTGKVLMPQGGSSEGAAPLVQGVADGSAPQRWQLVNMAGGTLKLVNAKSGLLLDLNGGNAAPGTAMIQWTDNNSDNQRLWPRSWGGGEFRLDTRYGLPIELSQGSDAEDLPVVQGSWFADDRQLWLLVRELPVEALFEPLPVAVGTRAQNSGRGSHSTPVGESSDRERVDVSGRRFAAETGGCHCDAVSLAKSCLVQCKWKHSFGR